MRIGYNKTDDLGQTVIGQYPDTNLYLELSEAAYAYREQQDEATSVTLLNAAAKFAAKAEIFRPIIEVWEVIREFTRMPEGSLPKGHDEVGGRAIHILAAPTSHKIDHQKTEEGTVVLLESLNWGIVWHLYDTFLLPGNIPLRLEHYRFEITSPEEMIRLGVNPGGYYWGVVNSLVGSVATALNRARWRERRLEDALVPLVMAEQIANLNNIPETQGDTP